MDINHSKTTPVMIARCRVEDFFPGLSPKTLANLNSKGEGPEVFKRGRKAFYRFDDLVESFKPNSAKEGEE
jgi:hypothetical protein